MWRVGQWLLRNVWRLIVLIVGGAVTLAGVVMLFTPGPAVVAIPLGLGILATEFAWARRLLRQARDAFRLKREQRSEGRRGDAETGRRGEERHGDTVRKDADAGAHDSSASAKRE